MAREMFGQGTGSAWVPEAGWGRGDGRGRVVGAECVRARAVSARGAGGEGHGGSNGSGGGERLGAADVRGRDGWAEG